MGGPAPLRLPTDLASRRITIVDFDEALFRTHSIERHPIFYGKSGLPRFDAPDGSYEVLYAGGDPFCAFIETFGHTTGTRIVTTTELTRKSLAELRPARALRLIDLTERGALVRIGADARLFSGDHNIAQLWSKALHDHPLNSDGLVYPSRLDPSRPAFALFKDRAPSIVELSREGWYAPGSQRQLLAQILDHYAFELIENRFVARRKPAERVTQNLLDWES